MEEEVLRENATAEVTAKAVLVKATATATSAAHLPTVVVPITLTPITAKKKTVKRKNCTNTHQHVPLKLGASLEPHKVQKHVGVELNKRVRQQPLKQPPYRFKHVPRCMPDLMDSEIYENFDRKIWKKMTPEMLLLCNEAYERLMSKTTDGTKNGSKPLNLNYIADRVDLDELIWGACIRHRETGWLQGFITASTFSSWHEWLHWDSTSVDAQLIPPPKSSEPVTCKRISESMDSPACSSKRSLSAYSTKERAWISKRKLDHNGFLGRELEMELRVRDPTGRHAQIWPHVAEVSLLGGLGSGRILLQMLLERLERPESQYRFVVTHATYGSIPFYEKLGFVRVGAVVRHRRKRVPQADLNAKMLRLKAERELVVRQTVNKEKSLLTIAVELHRQFLHACTIGKQASLTATVPAHPGSFRITLKDIIIDLMYLNPEIRHQFTHGEQQKSIMTQKVGNIGEHKEDVLTFSSNMIIRKGTSMRIPAIRSIHSSRCGPYAWDLWDQYIAHNDETPAMAFKTIKSRGSHPYLKFEDFLGANARHIRGLRTKSRMQEGTKLCIPKEIALDFRTLDEVVGYRHWTYSDELYWESPTSYMMVRRLHRRRLLDVGRSSPIEYGGSLDSNTFARISRLNARVQQHQRQLDACKITPGADAIVPLDAIATPLDRSEQQIENIFANDVCGKRCNCIYSSVLRALHFDFVDPNLPVVIKHPNSELHAPVLTSRIPVAVQGTGKKVNYDTGPVNMKESNFVNKVVRVNSASPNSVHTFYYVINFVQDLAWVRLVPMQCVGRFPSRGLVAAAAAFLGQPRWRLIEQGKAVELDVSTACVKVVKSRNLNPKVEDADQDDWIIPDDGGLVPVGTKIGHEPPLPGFVFRMPHLTPRNGQLRNRKIKKKPESTKSKSINKPVRKKCKRKAENPGSCGKSINYQLYRARNLLKCMFLKFAPNRMSDIGTLLCKSVHENPLDVVLREGLAYGLKSLKEIDVLALQHFYPNPAIVHPSPLLADSAAKTHDNSTKNKKKRAPVIANQPKDGKKVFNCHICSKNFKTKQSLNYHVDHAVCKKAGLGAEEIVMTPRFMQRHIRSQNICTSPPASTDVTPHTKTDTNVEIMKRSLNSDFDAVARVVKAKISTCKEETLQKIFTKLRGKHNYDFFNKPIEEQDVGPGFLNKYLDIIKAPMDFSTMHGRLKSGCYNFDSMSMLNDFRLIINNAKLFHDSSSLFAQEAVRLSKFIPWLSSQLKSILHQENKKEKINAVEKTSGHDDLAFVNKLIERVAIHEQIKKTESQCLTPGSDFSVACPALPLKNYSSSPRLFLHRVKRKIEQSVCNVKNDNTRVLRKSLKSHMFTTANSALDVNKSQANYKPMLNGKKRVLTKTVAPQAAPGTLAKKCKNAKNTKALMVTTNTINIGNDDWSTLKKCSEFQAKALSTRETNSQKLHEEKQKQAVGLPLKDNTFSSRVSTHNGHSNKPRSPDIALSKLQQHQLETKNEYALIGPSKKPFIGQNKQAMTDAAATTTTTSSYSESESSSYTYTPWSKMPSPIPGWSRHDVLLATKGLSNHRGLRHQGICTISDARLLDAALHARCRAWWDAKKKIGGKKRLKELCRLEKLEVGGNMRVLTLRLAFAGLSPLGINSSATPSVINPSSSAPIKIKSKSKENMKTIITTVAVHQRVLHKLADELLQQLKGLDRHGFFTVPVKEMVTANIWKDYQKFIPHPMDFKAMHQRLDNEEYLTADGINYIISDFELIVSNCEEYNGPASVYARAARALRTDAQPLIAKARLKWQAVLTTF